MSIHGRFLSPFSPTLRPLKTSLIFDWSCLTEGSKDRRIEVIEVIEVTEGSIDAEAIFLASFLST